MLSTRILSACNNQISSDPFAGDVSLLLHMDGTDGSKTFIDSSSASNIVTPIIGAKISTTQSKFGGSAAAFNGSTDCLTVPANSSFEFGTGDFTIECWFYQSSTPSGGALITESFSHTGNNVYFAIGFCNYQISSLTGDILFFGSYINSKWTGVVHNTALPNNQWHHVAACRHAGIVKLYANGIGFSPGVSYADNIPIEGEIYIGKRWDLTGSSSFFNGYIDEVRITKGVARYTENFTPPTAPFPNP